MCTGAGVAADGAEHQHATAANTAAYVVATARAATAAAATIAAVGLYETKSSSNIWNEFRRMHDMT